MKLKNKIAILSALAELTLTASPVYLALDGYSRYTGERIQVSGEVSESNSASYFSGIKIGNSYSISAEPAGRDLINLMLSHPFSVSGDSLNLAGKTSPFAAGNSYQYSLGLTNVVLSWSETAHLYTRIVNSTRYPLILSTPSDNPEEVTIPSGCGITKRLPQESTISLKDASDKLDYEIVTGNGSILHFGDINNFKLPHSPNIWGRIEIREKTPSLSSLPMFSDSDDIIHGQSDSIIHSDILKSILPSNMLVWVEWKFNPSDNGSLNAVINDKVVCDAHSTEHIIEHVIYQGSNKEVYDPSAGCYTWEYSVSLIDSSSSSRGCVFRTWIGATSFVDAAESLRVEFAGFNPRFRLRYFPYYNKWTLQLIKDTL